MLFKLFGSQCLSVVSSNKQCVRSAFIKSIKAVKYMKGLPPYKAKTLAQKFEEHNYKDPSVYYKVDIGFPQIVQKNLKDKSAHFKKLKSDSELEKKARNNELTLCLEDVTREWLQESAPQHIKLAAEHYGIFQDLFGDAFFYPATNLDVAFNHKEGLVPVCRGNTLKPSQALSAPVINYEADPDTLWTLIASNPDGNLLQEDKEYLHWFLGNIPGNQVEKGEVIADYVQPFPARGTGFQRVVFVLYKQDKKIDYSSLKVHSKQSNLKDRIFKTYDLYRSHQDQLTPAGLAFCQVDWDYSVSQFFHTELGMEEPVYQYDFAPHYLKKQKMFPLRQPFNLYLDRYRDPKQIAKEYLLRKLKDRHPFEKPKPPLRFPNALPVQHDLDEKLYGRIPSWLRREKLKQRLGHGRINDY